MTRAPVRISGGAEGLHGAFAANRTSAELGRRPRESAPPVLKQRVGGICSLGQS